MQLVKFGITLLIYSYCTCSLAQIAKMVPGSTLYITSSSQTNGSATSCSTGLDPFLTLFRANGWNVQGDSTIPANTEKLPPSVSGKQTRTQITYRSNFHTIEQNSKRIRRWSLVTEVSTTIGPFIYSEECQSHAQLQGDRIDDYLQIDIGVHGGWRQKQPGEIYRFSNYFIMAPRYCSSMWFDVDKITRISVEKQVSCESLGIDIPEVFKQTINTMPI